METGTDITGMGTGIRPLYAQRLLGCDHEVLFGALAERIQAVQ